MMDVRPKDGRALRLLKFILIKKETMITAQKLIEEIKKFPETSFCYAYEGEVTGIIVVDKNGKELGYIITSESHSDDFQSKTILTKAGRGWKL